MAPWITFYVQGTATSPFLILCEVYRFSGRLTQAVSSSAAELCALREALRLLLHHGPRLWFLLCLRGCTSSIADLSRDIARRGTMLVSKSADVRLQ